MAGSIGINAIFALFSAKNVGDNIDGFATSQCFVAGTLVLTIEGSKAIEEIQAGDLVYSTNPETGESKYKEVVQTFENETEELVHISVCDDEIITTLKHPFYVPQKGWTSAIDLRAGDILVLSNGEYVIVEKVQHEILESPVKVYNFEVQDFHTYYVGENSVLVHNQCEVLTWNEYQKENKGKTSTENSQGWADYKESHGLNTPTTTNSEHGNSLSTTKPAKGYSLRDKDTYDILKYGETTMGEKRYTQSYLDSVNAIIYWEAAGTKAEMHLWQHEKILDYMYVADHRPPLNKSLW